MKTLIKNGLICTENDILKDGFVIIEDETISGIGSGEAADSECTRIIDARGGIVMPGLINCHTHVPMTLFRGYGDDLPLHRWLEERIFPAEDKLTGNAAYWGAMLTFAEMIKSGTTAFADMYFFSEDIIKALIDSGMKGNIARTVTGMGEDDFQRPLDEAVALYRTYNGAENGRVKIDHALHAVYTCSEAAVRAVAETALRDGAVVQIHISETQKENEDCMAAYGVSPTELLRRNGLFDCRVNAAHCVWLSEDDMEIFSHASHAGIAHNPTSNLKLASGIAPVARMLERGLTVGLGTDGAASNNCLNLFGEMKLAALLQKGIALDSTVVPAKQAFRMATADGASILGRDDTGVLRVGAKADIVILDSDAPNLIPVHDALSNVVYSEAGGSVRTVLVNGKLLLDHGEFTTLDIEKIKSKVNRYLDLFD